MSVTPAWGGESVWGEENRSIPRSCWLAYQLIGSRAVRNSHQNNNNNGDNDIINNNNKVESNRGSHLTLLVSTHTNRQTHTQIKINLYWFLLLLFPQHSKLLRAIVARGTSQMAATGACQLCISHSVMDWEALKSSTHSEEIHKEIHIQTISCDFKWPRYWEGAHAEVSEERWCCCLSGGSVAEQLCRKGSGGPHPWHHINHSSKTNAILYFSLRVWPHLILYIFYVYVI